MTIKFEVTRAFGIPREQLERPIHGDLLEAIGGFTPEVRNWTPAQIALALVLVEGYSYGGQKSWGLVARSAHSGDEEEPIFGSVQISDDGGLRITPDQALQAGDAWIRASENTEFVPGPAVLLPIPEDLRSSSIAGLLLVRAAVQ